MTELSEPFFAAWNVTGTAMLKAKICLLGFGRAQSEQILFAQRRLIETRQPKTLALNLLSRLSRLIAYLKQMPPIRHQQTLPRIHILRSLNPCLNAQNPRREYEQIP